MLESSFSQQIRRRFGRALESSTREEGYDFCILGSDIKPEMTANFAESYRKQTRTLARRVGMQNQPELIGTPICHILPEIMITDEGVFWLSNLAFDPKNQFFLSWPDAVILKDHIVVGHKLEREKIPEALKRGMGTTSFIRGLSILTAAALLIAFLNNSNETKLLFVGSAFLVFGAILHRSLKEREREIAERIVMFTDKGIRWFAPNAKIANALANIIKEGALIYLKANKELSKNQS